MSDERSMKPVWCESQFGRVVARAARKARRTSDQRAIEELVHEQRRSLLHRPQTETKTDTVPSAGRNLVGLAVRVLVGRRHELQDLLRDEGRRGLQGKPDDA